MPLQNFGVVVPRMLYRCAQPDPRGFRDLWDLGVRSVLKLSTHGEYALALEQRHVGDGGTVIPIDIGFPVVSERSVRIAADTIKAQLDLGCPTVVHCVKGRDRTGGVIAAWRLLYEGWDLARAMDERETFGTGEFLDATFNRGIVEVLEIIHGER